jgi:DNA-binding SARP family transcriptional activator
MLMTLLAIETGREVSRERVYSVLWPEADYTHARDNFYALWSILRRSLGELSVPDDCLIRMPESIRLNRELVSADTMELEYLVRMLSSSRLDDAELIGGYSHVDELYQGDLIDMDDHQHIFETARTGYRDLFVNAMIEGSTLAIRMNQGLSALLFAQRAYEQGEPSEEVYRCVMRAQVHEGMYGSARATFEEYREFVAQTYGLPPSQEMVELYDRIILPRWRGRRTDLDLAVE